MIFKYIPKREISMRPCALLFVVAWLLLSAFFFLECEAQENENTTPYKVVDSGMWAWDSGEGAQSWWINNEQVLFPSNEKLQPNGGPKQMMIWNVSTGQVVPSQLRSVICVREGQVFFGKRNQPNDKVTYYRGPLNNPKEHPAPGPDMWIDSRFNCDWQVKNSRANIPYRIQLKGNNYIEVVEGKPDPGGWPQETSGDKRSKQSQPRVNKAQIGGPVLGKVIYYEQSGKKGVELPFQLGGWNGYDIQHIEWRNAYLVKPHQYYIDKPIHLWWLEPNGKVYEELLPEKYPFPAAGGIDFFPVKAGILVRYSGGSPFGSDGGYLIHERKVDRIFKNAAHEQAVSPDGCRVVFVHARNTEEYFSQTIPYRTLKLINFCVEGKGQ